VGASAFQLGDVVRTKAGVIKTADGLSLAASGMEASITTSVTYPPTVTITAPQQLGLCDGIALDVLGSLGTGGRPFKVLWGFVSATGSPALTNVETGAIRVLLPAISERTRLELPNSVLPANQAYIFSATLTNWLGISSTSTHAFAKQSAAIPKIAVTGATTVYVTRTDAVVFDITATGSTCGDGAAGGELDIQWAETTGAPMSLGDGAVAWLPPATASLSLPAGLLMPGSTYVFKLTASDPVEPAAVNTQEVTVVVEAVRTPKLLSAQFDNSMRAAYVLFDADTSTPQVCVEGLCNTPETCLAVLTPASVTLLGSRASCGWDSASKFAITLGSAYPLSVADLLQVQPGVLTSAGGFSDPLGADPADATTVPVAGPNTPPIPDIRVVGSSGDGVASLPMVVGSCDAVVLDFSISTGSAAKTWASAQWAVVPSTYLTKLPAEAYVPIQAYLEAQTDTSKLIVPSDLLPNRRTYVFELTLTNWVGGSRTTTVQVEKSALDIPQVLPTDKSTRIVNGDDTFLATIKVAPSACSTGDTSFTYVIL
jgi:hypothetical protein